MSGRKDGSPAFPAVAVEATGKIHAPYRRIYYPGMTLRDYFAGQALAGLLARSTSDVPHCDECRPVADDAGEHYADISYRYADAMLAAREK